MQIDAGEAQSLHDLHDGTGQGICMTEQGRAFA